MLPAPLPLAVVPILVNTGAALFPALLAAAAGFLALLLKPRELLRLLAARPLIPFGILLVAALTWAGFHFWPAPSKDTPSAASTTDWAKVALEILREQKRATTAPTPPAPASVSASPSPTANTPLIYRANPARTGHLAGPAPEKLTLRWEHNPEQLLHLSSPLVHAHRVYGASCLMDVGATYGSLVCLDARTGQPLWETAEHAGRDFIGFFSSPALSADGSRLVIGQGLHPDKNCDLLCLDTATGQVLWTVRTELHLESSPAIHGDLVVIGAGAIEEGPAKKVTGNPGYVLAVRLSTGEVLWRHPVNDPESSPAIAPDGTVFIGSGFNGSAIVALRSEDEATLQAKQLPRERWRTPVAHPATGAITLARDLVIAGIGNGDFVNAAAQPAGAIVALDPATGAIRWQTPLPDAVLGAVAFDGQRLYAPGRNGELFALDPTTGRILWHQALSGTAPLLAAPAVAHDRVYAVSRDGYLGIFRATDGTLLERHFINDPARPGALGLTLASPLLADGALYVASETGGLRRYDGLPASNTP